jgi:hypothetical protein
MVMTIGIIIPLFILGLRFWTAPVYINYRRKENSILAILALLPIMYSNDWEVRLLGMLVGWMNIYVFWYHVDPPANIY